MILKYIKEFYQFIKQIVGSRELLLTLIKHDFKKQYLGSYFGLIWAFAQPIVFMIVIWFVFEIGFRAGPIGDTPLFLWLITGMVPWFFLSDVFSQGTNTIVNNSFLVKQISFKISILPLVKLGSLLIIHIALVLFLVIMYFIYGYTITLYWLQIPYYILCSILLILGITWFTSAVRVFVKDVDYFITILIQMGFWLTPIFWSLDLVPQKYQYLIKLNPAYYIIEGYRDIFINQIWFWERSDLTTYFLTIMVVLLITGKLVFNRLRPHFGDIL